MIDSPIIHGIWSYHPVAIILTINPFKLPDASILCTHACLCGSLTEKSVQATTIHMWYYVVGSYINAGAILQPGSINAGVVSL